jgi:hypothetical protein
MERTRNQDRARSCTFGAVTRAGSQTRAGCRSRERTWLMEGWRSGVRERTLVVNDERPAGRRVSRRALSGDELVLIGAALAGCPALSR